MVSCNSLFLFCFAQYSEPLNHLILPFSGRNSSYCYLYPPILSIISCPSIHAASDICVISRIANYLTNITVLSDRYVQ